MKATTRSLITRAQTHKGSSSRTRKSVANAYKKARKHLGGAQVRANLTKQYGQ